MLCKWLVPQHYPRPAAPHQYGYYIFDAPHLYNFFIFGLPEPIFNVESSPEVDPEVFGGCSYDMASDRMGTARGSDGSEGSGF
jgi:hypothetical protein